MAADARVRARIERLLAAPTLPPAVVTAELALVAPLRAAHPRSPLVVVGIRRDQVVAALDAGADDALAGRLRPDELRARLRAVARRREPALRVGALELRPWGRSARLDGVALELAGGEFSLLCCLASAPGRVFTKDELARRLWDEPAGAPDRCGRALERRLARLRQRLGRHAPMLVTVWGVGYRLGEPD